MTMELNQLEPHAHLRIVAIAGGLTEDRAVPLLAVLHEMLAQWKQNLAIKTGAVELLEQNHFLAIAYESSGDDVSGCTKDQLTHALLDFEQRLGVAMLGAPSLAVELDGQVRFLDRDEFRKLRAQGSITESTVAFDHLVDRLGDLARFRTTVGESWYNRIGKPGTAQT